MNARIISFCLLFMFLALCAVFIRETRAEKAPDAGAEKNSATEAEAGVRPFSALPYEVGVTTREAARAQGARAIDKSGELADAVDWNGVPWRLTLHFSGSGSSAALKCLIMRTVSVEPELEMLIDKALAQERYNRFRNVHKDGVVHSVYGSERFLELRRQAAENHRGGLPPQREVGREMAGEVLIISAPGKSGWKMVLIRAGELGIGGPGRR